MKLLRIASVFVTIAGACAAAFVATPSVYGQSRGSAARRAPEVAMPIGPTSIGVTVHDGDKGVEIDEVRPDGPAAKAGLKTSDVVNEFDGERVRSARQFTRLVRETSAGRTVKATITRDGRRQEVQITPSADRAAEMYGMPDTAFDGERLRERLGELAERMPDFEFAMPDVTSRTRLGVVVQELTPQLAAYFGAKDGVLVASVVDDSPAARAGLKAGDVITSIDGQAIRTRVDLTRSVRNAGDKAVAIGIVRDKKESTVNATVEGPRRSTRRVRPA